MQQQPSNVVYAANSVNTPTYTTEYLPTVVLHAHLIYLMTDYIYCDFDYLFLVQTSVVMPE